MELEVPSEHQIHDEEECVLVLKGILEVRHEVALHHCQHVALFQHVVQRTLHFHQLLVDALDEEQITQTNNAQRME
jgi:hypothetical protein